MGGYCLNRFVQHHALSLVPSAISSFWRSVLLSGSEMPTGVLHIFLAGSYNLLLEARGEKIQADMLFIGFMMLKVCAWIWMSATRLDIAGCPTIRSEP